MHDFSILITDWYRRNSRCLPWRDTNDPYKIWLSEVIMQQTRVSQGEKYYLKFIDKFPRVNDLADASEQEVLKLWQGLGYYSRARNLHEAAKQIVADYNGVFPNHYKDIIKLKGVGVYTASAIASIAFNLPYAVVDGNVYRVLSRVFNDDTPIDTNEGKKIFQSYADSLLNKENPSIHNQAVMEVGALVCKPKNPDCYNCPINELCIAYRMGNVKELPVKKNKTVVKKRYFHYFIYPSDDIQIVKRVDDDIWKNMYEFPMVEINSVTSDKEVLNLLKSEYKTSPIRKIYKRKHILTHQHIFATFWEVDKKIPVDNSVIISVEETDKYPFPRLIDLFIEKNIDLFI